MIAVERIKKSLAFTIKKDYDIYMGSTKKKISLREETSLLHDEICAQLKESLHADIEDTFDHVSVTISNSGNSRCAFSAKTIALARAKGKIETLMDLLSGL